MQCNAQNGPNSHEMLPAPLPLPRKFETVVSSQQLQLELDQVWAMYIQDNIVMRWLQDKLKKASTQRRHKLVPFILDTWEQWIADLCVQVCSYMCSDGIPKAFKPVEAEYLALRRLFAPFGVRVTGDPGPGTAQWDQLRDELRHRPAKDEPDLPADVLVTNPIEILTLLREPVAYSCGAGAEWLRTLRELGPAGGGRRVALPLVGMGHRILPLHSHVFLFLVGVKGGGGDGGGLVQGTAVNVETRYETVEAVWGEYREWSGFRTLERMRAFFRSPGTKKHFLILKDLHLHADAALMRPQCALPWTQGDRPQRDHGTMVRFWFDCAPQQVGLLLPPAGAAEFCALQVRRRGAGGFEGVALARRTESGLEIACGGRLEKVPGAKAEETCTNAHVKAGVEYRRILEEKMALTASSDDDGYAPPGAVLQPVVVLVVRLRFPAPDLRVQCRGRTEGREAERQGATQAS